MFTLRLLGAPSLEAPDGLVTGRAAQGRRLALLALLALARGRPLSRDKLVGLLWPDASPVRARPQLSDALYVVRNALGEAAVQSRGDGLALDDSIVTSDVARFEALLDEGRLEDAVALYSGPLLDGFHVPDSTEFEHWLDGERARLERLYLQALEKLAEAATDPAAAVDWWRRRAGHDPFSARVALRLMQALDAAGDRAGAIQHARLHATLLRAEFDAHPDADVAAFADRLRSEPPASAAAPSSLPPVVSAIRVDASSAPIAERDPAASDVPSPAQQIERPAAGATGSDTPARRRPRRSLLAVTALVALLAVGVTYGVGRRTAPAPPRSIGVLPFVNMSADAANTYFSDGLSEQIILALSRIDGLQVAARTSSFALRNRELGVRAIGDTLGVQAVLEGSVLVDGDRLRVIAQLIDARTGYHIWSDHYDGEVSDVLAVQGRIAAAISRALHLRLAAGEPVAAAAPSIEAYDFYLRGLYLRNSLSDDALRHASAYFDSAIAREPRFALAWAAKATVIAPLGYFGYAGRDSVMTEMRRVIDRALALDPALGEAHAALGLLKLFYEWDWEAARRALLRAIELNPNDAHSWHHLANYHSAAGAQHDAIAARERAVELDPLNARTRIVLSGDYVIAGDTARALEEAQRAARLDPMHPLLLGIGPSLPVGLPHVYLSFGRIEEATEEYLRIAALRGATRDELDAIRNGARAGKTGLWRAWRDMDVRHSGASMNTLRMAALHLASGDTAQGLDWLERAWAERNPGAIYLRRDPLYAAMAGHPRVERLLRAMNLLQETLE